MTILRSQLLRAGRECGGIPSTGKGARDTRSAARAIGRLASTQLDELWDKAADAPAGPIEVIDLFSGCGGMSAGFAAINAVVPAYRLVAAVDIDEVANGTYTDNLGVAPVCADVGQLAADSRLLGNLTRGRRNRRSPLVLIGCSPCQGFSSHRNKRGAGDTRNSLFVDFARLAVKLRPDVVVSENVPELLTDSYWEWVTTARAEFERAGYATHLAVHDMATFGVPQQRFRALLLAMRRPFAPPSGFLGGGAFRTVRDAIGHLGAVVAGERHRDDELHVSARHRPETLATIRAVPKNGGNRPYGIGPECLRRVEIRQGRAAYEDVYGRLHWDRPAITLTHYARNPASGRFVHPEQDRGLTIREAALLQGFPATYRFGGSLDDCFRQIGNAVPPMFSAYVAGHILGELVADKEDALGFDEGLTAPVGASFSRLIPGIKASTARKAA
jgi:DNA (cytosine-5)-methyltransferase 1